MPLPVTSLRAPLHHRLPLTHVSDTATLPSFTLPSTNPHSPGPTTCITAGSSLFPRKRNRVVLRCDRVVLVPVCLESPVCGRYPLKILLFYLRRLPSYFPEVVHLSIQTVVIKSQKFKVKTPGHKPSLAAYGTVWSYTYEILRSPRLHVCMNNTIILSWGLLGNSKWTTVKDSSK